jgi:hypothetical protein
MPTGDALKPNPLPCEKCGMATTLAAYIPGFGDRPAYRIFDCTACKALTWIAEKISE